MSIAGDEYKDRVKAEIELAAIKRDLQDIRDIWLKCGDLQAAMDCISMIIYRHTVDKE